MVSLWSRGLSPDDIDNTMSRALTISGISLLLIGACTRPHPLAEWDPDAYAPGTPTASWSADWWPAARTQTESRQAAEARAMDPMLPPTILRELGPLPKRADLADAVDIALLRNPETRIAWGQARVKAAEYAMSRSDWYPTIAAIFDASYEQSLVPFGGTVDIQEDVLAHLGVGLELTWTLLDFGRRQAEDDEFSNALLASNLMFNRSLQNVIHSVQIRYFSLESADGMVTASRQDFLLAESVLASLEQKYVVGLATLPELLIARQSHERAGYELESAQAMRHEARSDLLVAMGLMPGVPIEFALDAEAPLPDELVVDVNRLIELAMAARPDLAAAMAKLKQAEAAVASAEAQLRPQIDVAANVNYNWLEYWLTPAFEEPADGHGNHPTWMIGLVGSWVLFDGEERTNRIRAARAEQLVAIETLQQARLEVAGQVWDAYFQWEAAAQQFEWAESLLASSNATLEATVASYQVGLRTMPELLVARRGMADAREAYIRSRARVLSASANLVHATGDLRVEG